MHEVWNSATDCSTALSDALFANPPAFPYNPAGSSVTITSIYTEILAHQNDASCPLTSCGLFETSDCSTGLIPTEISIGVSPAYGITASETVAAGYSETFCF